MSSSAIEPRFVGQRAGNATSARLLDELRFAHKALLAAMEVIDGLTREPEFDSARFANARWRISQASLTRRMLWGTIFRHLLPRVSPEEAADLEILGHADREMLRHSANHIAIWVLARIEADWEGYCEASRAIRRRMKACMDAEHRLLYPMMVRDAGCS